MPSDRHEQEADGRNRTQRGGELRLDRSVPRLRRRGTRSGERRVRALAALIEAFDEVVLTRFDHRLLALDDLALAETRALRRDAEADCAAGRYRLGLQAIEEALRAVGVGPAIEAGSPPD